MVGVNSLCSTLLICATLNNVATEEVVAQISYDTITQEELTDVVEDGVNPYSPREILSNESQAILEGYLQFKEQQELQKQQELEEELAKQRAIKEQYPYEEYRQTYYSVVENNETKVGAGYSYNDSQIKVIDNVMNFYDREYGYLPVYAIDMNEVYASGLNERGTPNVYGSIIELSNGDSTWFGVVLDACGQCRYDDKIDLWTYRNQQSLDVDGIKYRYVRYGWGE